MRENLTVYGSVVIRKKRGGVVVKEWRRDNLVVDVGKTLIVSRLRNLDTKPTHMALGTSATAPASGQTALQGTELARLAFSGESQSANSVTYTANFTGSWTGTVEEAGIFNDATTGTMLARFLTGTFDKDSNDEIEVQWTLTIG